MSYILEALKKSEQERRLGHVPDISVLQEAPARAPQRWQRWLLAALLVNLLVLLIVAWRPWARPAAPVPTQAATERKAAEPAMEDAGSPPAVTAQDVTPLPPPVTTTAIEPAPVAAAAPSPEPAPRAVEPVSALPPEAPRWQDLPADQRNALPVPRIDVHVFAQDPSRRFVLIDLRKYHEGERLDGGATIESIRNDGIVLSYQGQRYRVDRP